MRDAFRLGDWLVQPGVNQISRDGRVIRLRARVMDLLVFLAEHAGQALSKDEILERVWGGKFIAESSLTTALTTIRQAFQDDAHDPWLIETIPKRGYRLIAAPESAAAASAVPARRTVIVLPFRNSSGDPEQDYLARGVSASIWEALWRMQAVRVSSVVAENDVAAIVSQPGAANAVTVGGEVARTGDRVLVRTWLEDNTSKTRLWSASYRPSFADIVSLYDAVGTAIAAELNTSIDAVPPGKPTNPDAYDEYLRGRYGQLRWMSGGCTDAELHLLRATQIDPTFVAAWVELASCYVFPDRLRRPIAELAPQARAAIDTALRLAPRSGMAHANKAIVAYRFDYDWACAADELAIAHRLEPRNALVTEAYAEFLFMSGRAEEGLGLSKRALELNPFAPDINVAYGFMLMIDRRYAEAAAQLRRALTMEPGAATARFWLSETEACLGHFDIAAREYAAWLDTAARPVAEDAIGCDVNACREGEWPACERAGLALAEMERTRPGAAFKGPYGRYAGAYYQSRRYARTGRAERAMDLLEQAHRERHHLMPCIGIDPAFDVLRDTPRFQALRRAVGPPAK